MRLHRISPQVRRYSCHDLLECASHNLDKLGIWPGATGGGSGTGIQHSPYCGKLTAGAMSGRFLGAGGDCAIASAGQRGRPVEKAIVIDLLDEEIRHISSRDESRGPVARIDQHAVCARARSVG